MKLFSKKMLQKWSFDETLNQISQVKKNYSQKKNFQKLDFVNSFEEQNTENPQINGSSALRLRETEGWGASRGEAPAASPPDSKASVKSAQTFKQKKSLLESVVSNQIINPTNFIQIGLASSDEIQNWAERSYFLGQQFVEIGEVKRPDTLNYRTFKPEKDGLFCERIFGPVNDWSCSCGQIKEQRFAMDHERALLGKLKPKICPVCHVEVTSSRLRRYRMGYISLACPVTHIWYLNSRPSLFSILLKMPTKYIKKIAYYKAYSPSTLQREYMSSCLGPGGDFFDNEWEFLHLWLAGKHSIEDIPSRITHFIQSKKNESIQDFQLLNTVKSDSEAKLKQLFNEDFNELHPWQEKNSSHQFFETQQKVSEGFPNSEVPPKAGDISFASFSNGKLGMEGFAPQILAGLKTEFSSTQGRLKYSLKKNLESLTPSVVKNEVFTPGRIDKVKPSFMGVSRRVKLSTKPRDIFTSIEYLKMPESPEWLANTGAQALMNHLKSRDWQKETEKLELEFQSTSLTSENFPMNVWTEEPRVVKNGVFPPTSFCEAKPGVLENKVFSPARISEGKPQLRKDRPEGLGTASRGASMAASPLETDFLLKRRKNRNRTLKLLKSFQKSGLPFSGMIFHALPVLPPELRPIIQLGAGQLASSDVNDLYRRIISRNNRLKYYLYETHFVEFLVRSEQQLVQLAVDALLENGKTTSVRHTSGQKRLYKSLSDRIGGKQGRFRMNLLGKRVDYSGRSVIVVGPRLKLFQCGLPYEMALELFQPFLLRHMLELQLAKTIRAAKNILRFNKPLARQLLHHVVQAHPILLNRAPTLHRLGIQAFQPVLVYGRAIHLHPLVCPAFNADFDGDQMAVHIPLSPQSRIEARLLMLASGNWLSVSTGQPNVLPSQDMVLGFYYLTIEKYGYQKGRGLIFQSLTDVMQAYELGSLDLHSQIWLKWYGPFTGDSNSRLTSPQKHNFREKLIVGKLSMNFSKVQSQNWNGKRFHNLISRFRRDADQPIEIRLNKNGISTKIYSSYQWQQDLQEKERVCYIRTTPGRVLMNQIFQKFS